MLNSYFYLCEDNVLVKGAKHSILLDFKNGRIYRVNSSARSIIELGNRGFTAAEVSEKLKHRVDTSDTLSFIQSLSDDGTITFSATQPKHAQKEKPAPILSFLWIELTPRCNLHCLHCYASAEKEDAQSDCPSTREVKKIIDDASALGCRDIQFTGGEATLRSDLKLLIRYAKQKGFEIEVFTNATQLTEPLVKFLSKQGVSVAVSVYSHKAKTHDAITRVPGSWKRTLNGIKLLKAHNVPVRCSVIAMKQNESELEDTVNFLLALGVKTRPPDPVRPSGRGIEMQNWPEEYGKKSLQTKPLFFISRELYERNRSWNSCWFGRAAVTSNGDVLPCVFARKQVVGNVKEKSLRKIILGREMLKLWRLSMDRIEVCKDCEYRYVCEDCRPWAYGLTDNLCAKSPRCTYNPYTGEWGSVDGALSSLPECVGTQTKARR